MTDLEGMTLEEQREDMVARELFALHQSLDRLSGWLKDHDVRDYINAEHVAITEALTKLDRLQWLNYKLTIQDRRAA
jgi:hypothetical protein